MMRPVLCITLLSFAVACSGTEEGPPAGPDPLETAAGFCGEWGRVACNEEVLSACSSEREGCIEAQSEFCLDLLPEDGYVRTRAQQCITAVRQAYADADLSAEELFVVRNLDGACSQLVRGPVEEGDACIESIQCNTVDGYECIARPGMTSGTCQIPVVVEPGLSCAGDDQICGEDFYCNGSNCVVRHGENQGCDFDEECEASLRCEVESNGAAGAPPVPTEGACVPRTPITGDCTADEDCETHLCARGSNDDMGVCVDNVRLSVIGPICQDLR